MGVLFRVDAGPGVGLGHLQRCLSLACALRERNVESFFLSNKAPESAERIASFNFQMELTHGAPSWGPEDAALTRAMAGRREWTTVAVDSLLKGPDYLQSLCDTGLAVCSMEDLVSYPFPCSLVVNGAAQANGWEYRSSSGKTRFLLGTEYALLRQELWDLPVRPVRPQARKVLVTLGGADAHHLMPALLRAIGGLPQQPEIIAVIGPYFDHREELERTAGSLRSVRLETGLFSLRALMEEADLAVSAAGQTLYELARTGCPTLAFCSPLGLDQKLQLEAVARSGFALSLGDVTEGDLCARVREEASVLLEDASRRAAMAVAGRRLVDGQGARRVAEAVLALKPSRIGEVKVLE